MERNKMKIEVSYALPERQVILAIYVDEESTIQAAILQSGLLTDFPEIDLNTQKVGIFGKIRQLTDPVEEGDRIEIYRPLTIDPKEARRAKAKNRLKK